MSSRRCRAVAAAAVVAATLLPAAPASRPSGAGAEGPRPAAGTRRTPRCRSSPRTPVPGASPAAGGAGLPARPAPTSADDHEVARMYLTGRAAQRWRPAAETVGARRRRGPPRSRERGGRLGRRAGRPRSPGIDAEGDATGGLAGEPPSLTRTFRMEREDGEWRIAALDDGLVLCPARRRPDLPPGLALLPVAVAQLARARHASCVPELPGLTDEGRVPAAARADGRRCAARCSRPSRRAPSSRCSRSRCGTASRRCRWTTRCSTADAGRRASRCPRSSSGRSSSCPEIDRVRITRGRRRPASCRVAPQDQAATPGSTYDPDGFSGSPSALRRARRPGGGGSSRAASQPWPGRRATGDVPVARRRPSRSTRSRAGGRDGRRHRAARRAGWPPTGPSPRSCTRRRPEPARRGTRRATLWVVDRSTGRLLLLPGGAAPAGRRWTSPAARRPARPQVARRRATAPGSRWSAAGGRARPPARSAPSTGVEPRRRRAGTPRVADPGGARDPPAAARRPRRRVGRRDHAGGARQPRRRAGGAVPDRPRTATTWRPWSREAGPRRRSRRHRCRRAGPLIGGTADGRAAAVHLGARLGRPRRGDATRPTRADRPPSTAPSGRPQSGAAYAGQAPRSGRDAAPA